MSLDAQTQAERDARAKKTLDEFIQELPAEVELDEELLKGITGGATLPEEGIARIRLFYTGTKEPWTTHASSLAEGSAHQISVLAKALGITQQEVYDLLCIYSD